MGLRVSKRTLNLLSALVILFCLAVVGFVQFYLKASGPLQGEALVLVARGTGVAGIARTLERQGAIRYPFLFRVGYYTHFSGRPLMAGEYVLPPGASPHGILTKLASGDVYRRSVTIPEGYSAKQVKAVLDRADGLTGELVGELAEGSVLPETYQYIWGDTRQDVLARMQAAQREAAEKLWRERAEGLPFSHLAEAVTLASIVEKETGVPEERPAVASVFLNRLAKRMPLQSDPTVIYALTGGLPLGRALTRRDLEQTQSPFNTYRNAGLPPAPIANPGLESLKAVLAPPSTDYLYFVADGKGGHVFARTLDEHNRNVRRYKLELAKQKREQKAAQGTPAP